MLRIEILLDDFDRTATADSLCIGYLYIEDGIQVGKLWINRNECPGRTTPR
jgi:hypothetical protein